MNWEDNEKIDYCEICGKLRRLNYKDTCKECHEWIEGERYEN